MQLCINGLCCPPLRQWRLFADSQMLYSIFPHVLSWDWASKQLGSSPSSDTGSCSRVCVCVCVCVCVRERERERERDRDRDRDRETERGFTSDPLWMSVLWLYLLPGWPRGGVDKVPWKAGPGVLQVQIHDQLWALQEEAVRSGTHLGTRNLGQDWQLIHRKVDLPFSK